MKILLTLFLLVTYCLPLSGTIRYVSHSGSNTPPYTSWETAADSIMSAINISVFGDTIYVASGVYKEQVVMIPGLSLIGAGMDSTVIDARDYVVNWNSIAVEIADSILLKGFNIIASNNIEIGMGIAGTGSSNSLVTLNRITNAFFGVFLDATFFDIADASIYKNICYNVVDGIEMFNSNSIIKGNYIYNGNLSGISERGISLGAYDNNYKPVIDSNYIETFGDGIRKSFGAEPIISNNTIILKTVAESQGIFLSYSDSAKVYNNLIYAEGGRNGIVNAGVQYLQLYNNYMTGNFDDQQNLAYVLVVGPDNVVKNNVVTNTERGVQKFYQQQDPIFKYNDVWNNGINYQNFTPDSTNLSVDPMVVNEDTTQGELDFHLQKYSPLIDAGDPEILDIDGSRSDIGLWGGPYGERYTYRDLAPKPPSNITAEYDSGLVKLTWNRNTEADFYRYRVYRDTVANFIYDTTKIIAVVADTFYYDDLPEKYLAKNYYYKLTAMDRTGHQSAASEEVNVVITGIPEAPPIAVEEYKLLNNYPNPFNPSTIIPYRLKEPGYVKLYVYDIQGELVKVLVNGYQSAGYYEVEFKPNKTEREKGSLGIEWATGYNNDIASGVYIYQIMVKSDGNIPVFSDMKKMILLK